MRSENVVYCVAEGESLCIFAASLAALSQNGKTIIAKFQGTIMYIAPATPQAEILNRFSRAEYEAPCARLIGNL